MVAECRFLATPQADSNRLGRIWSQMKANNQWKLFEGGGYFYFAFWGAPGGPVFRFLAKIAYGCDIMPQWQLTGCSYHRQTIYGWKALEKLYNLGLFATSYNWFWEGPLSHICGTWGPISAKMQLLARHSQLNVKSEYTIGFLMKFSIF